MRETVTKRIYVGGLASNVSSEEIYERFSKFGNVSNLSFTKRTDEFSGCQFKTFAHLTLEGDETDINKCFSTYQNAKWKGSVLQLQYAKESFLQKLETERQEARNQKEDIPGAKPSPSSHKLESGQFELKGPAVPGTPVPGKKDWVVGKYGRVLPILKLKKSYKIKMMKYDPSKHCHAAKVFKDDQIKTLSEASCDKLTWEINTPDNEITKKRKGEFPDVPESSKKVKGVSHLLSNSSKKTQQLLPNKKENEDVEIVKVGSESSSLTNKINRTNRFDSDVDSGSEDEGLATRLPLKKRNVSQLTSKSSDIKTVTPANMKHDKLLLKLTSRNGEVSNSEAVIRSNDTKTLAHEASDTTSQRLPLRNSEVTTTTKIPAHTDQGKPRAKAALGVGKNEFVGCERKVPEFKGLGMLGLMQQCSRVTQVQSDPATGSPSNVSFDDTSVPVSNPKVKAAAVDFSNDRTLLGTPTLDKPDAVPAFSSLSSLSTVPNVKRNISAEVPFSSLTHSKKKEKQNSSTYPKGRVSPPETRQPVLSHDFSDSRMDVSKNYDSSSSADTDEIIARYKRSKGLSHTSLTDSPRNSSTSSNARNLHDLDKNKRNPLVDPNLSLSEFAAEITEFSDQSVPRIDSVQHNLPDSSDSDLDSNDFELVVQKLAQKALSSKMDIKGLGDKSQDKNILSLGQCISNRGPQNKQIMPLASAGGLVTAPVNSRSADKNKSSPANNMSSAANNKSLPVNSKSLPANNMSSAANNKSLPVNSKSLPANNMSSAANNKSSPANNMSSPANNMSSVANSKSSAKNKSSPVDNMSSVANNKSSVQSKSSLSGSIALSKQAVDNEKRLQAVRENIKLKQLQQSISLNALKNVDSKDGTFGKRLVFSSSSSEDDASNVDTTTTKINEKSKLELFDSSDEEENYDDIFKSKPHFEGKKGEKLMKLEQKIGDARFKLDAKFAVSDSEEEESEQHRHSSQTREMDKSLEDEKSANLKVLENVIGKTALDRFSEKLKRNTKSIIDMNAVRFDPTKNQNKTPAVSGQLSQIRMTQKEHTNKQTGLTSWTTEGQVKHKTDEKNQKSDKIKKLAELDPGKKRVPETKDSKVKLKSEKSQLRTTEKSVSNKTDCVSNSKRQVSSSLLNFFKKKSESCLDNEDTEAFSLLQQFDEDESYNESKDDGESNQDKRGLTPAPLSALFKKEAEKASMICENKTVPAKSRSLQSDGDSSSGVLSEDDTSGDEEINLEERREQMREAEQKERRVPLPVDKDDSEEETLINEERSHLPANDDLELISAGRVDVRFSQEQWLQRWEDIRPELIKVYKRKHKDALRNKRKQNETKRKKEFLKNSRRNRWAHKRVS